MSFWPVARMSRTLPTSRGVELPRPSQSRSVRRRRIDLGGADKDEAHFHRTDHPSMLREPYALIMWHLRSSDDAMLTLCGWLYEQKRIGRILARPATPDQSGSPFKAPLPGRRRRPMRRRSGSQLPELPVARAVWKVRRFRLPSPGVLQRTPK